MKIISWNIAGKIKCRNRQIDRVALQNADIVAFQEVRRPDELCKRLKSVGFSNFVAAPEDVAGNKVVAVASKLSIKLIAPIDVPHLHRIVSCGLLVAGRSVNLHCVHVPPGSNYGQIKVETLEAITNGLLNRSLPQLVVGDFNCPRLIHPDIVTWAQRELPDGTWRVAKSVRKISGERWHSAEKTILQPRQDMVEVFSHLNPNSTEVSYVTNAKGGGNRFDHMLASIAILPQVIEYDHEVRVEGLSDHSPLIAEWTR